VAVPWRGALRLTEQAAGASPARAKTASPPGGGIRPDGEETEQPGTGGQPWDATAAARTRRWPLSVAVIGDGSFQLIAQDLANMIRHG
jgi:hypothetical protein